MKNHMRECFLTIRLAKIQKHDIRLSLYTSAKIEKGDKLL